ncbi:hypothetical protein CEXT_20411, partial [Caerostris extrusa]
GLLAKYIWQSPVWLSPSYQVWKWVNILGQGRPVRPNKLTTARVAGSAHLSNMECVNLLGQGIPDSQIQLTADRVAVSFLSNMEWVNFLGRGKPISQIQMAAAHVAVSFYQIFNASTFLGKLFRLAKTTGRRGVSFLPINMECVNFLGQGRPVSQIKLPSARVTISVISNMECVNLLSYN